MTSEKLALATSLRNVVQSIVTEIRTKEEQQKQAKEQEAKEYEEKQRLQARADFLASVQSVTGLRFSDGDIEVRSFRFSEPNPDEDMTDPFDDTPTDSLTILTLPYAIDENGTRLAHSGQLCLMYPWQDDLFIYPVSNSRQQIADYSKSAIALYLSGNLKPHRVPRSVAELNYWTQTTRLRYDGTQEQKDALYEMQRQYNECYTPGEFLMWEQRFRDRRTEWEAQAQKAAPIGVASKGAELKVTVDSVMSQPLTRNGYDVQMYDLLQYEQVLALRRIADALERAYPGPDQEATAAEEA